MVKGMEAVSLFTVILTLLPPSSAQKAPYFFGGNPVTCNRLLLNPGNPVTYLQACLITWSTLQNVQDMNGIFKYVEFDTDTLKFSSQVFINITKFRRRDVY